MRRPISSGLAGSRPDGRAEDVEFSRRAVARGLQIVYRPDAVGYHNHVLSLDQLVRKEFDNHVGLVPFLAAQPDALEDFPYLREQWPLAWGVIRRACAAQGGACGAGQPAGPGRSLRPLHGGRALLALAGPAGFPGLEADRRVPVAWAARWHARVRLEAPCETLVCCATRGPSS